MTIREYHSGGKTLFSVYVHVKSKTKTKLRIQKRKKNIETLKQAERVEKMLIKEALVKLGYLESQQGTWGSIIESWHRDQLTSTFNHRYSNKFTIEDYRNMLIRHTSPWLKRQPHELTRADGKMILDKLSLDQKSRSFILKVKNTINLVYQWGIDNRLISGSYTSPVNGIKLNERSEKFPEILNLSQIRTFLSEAKIHNHKWYPVWAMALLTGMRSGELYALEWGDVDFERKLIRIKRSFSKRTNEIKSTKAGYWRNVPISEELDALLVSLKSQAVGSSWVLPRLRYWERGEQAKPLRLFLAEISLPPVKFHTLRACFATQLLADGIETAKVMKIGGWKDLKTMEIYLRLAGVDEKGATEGLRFLPSEEVLAERVVELFKKK